MRRSFASLLFVLLFATCLQAAEVVGYSGMVRIADNSYLTVNDRKNPIHSGSRFGVLTVTARDGTVFQHLPVKDWHDEAKDPSDLEACCAVPGRESEYLLAESGKFKNKFGRIFHVRVKRNAESVWEAECLGVVKPERRALDEAGTTWDGDQIEGLGCFLGFDNKPILVLGERGGKTKEGHKCGRLVWGELDLTGYRFTPQGDEALVMQSVIEGGRDCSDLYIEVQDKSFTVWSVATVDSSDAGPFQSAVYRAGKFVLDDEKKQAIFQREEKPVVAYELHGLKVEALAAPPKCVPNSMFSIGTDDESFGGIWRALRKKP